MCLMRVVRFFSFSTSLAVAVTVNASEPGSLTASLIATKDIEGIIGAIGDLESVKDPKCYATASRLENFIYGTPLTSEARFKKIALQKRLVFKVWKLASQLSRKDGESNVSITNMRKALKTFHIPVADTQQDLHFKPARYKSLVLKQDDIRHYSSIAYSLRAVLGVQQDAILSGELELQPMDKEAISQLKESVDLATLLALQIADQRARKDSIYSISEADFIAAWKLLLPEETVEVKTVEINDKHVGENKADLSITRV